MTKKGPKLSVSGAVLPFYPKTAETIERLLCEADSGLYARKQPKNVACGVQAYLHGSSRPVSPPFAKLKQNGPGLDGIMEACRKKTKKDTPEPATQACVKLENGGATHREVARKEYRACQ